MFEHLEILFDDPNRIRDAKFRLHSNKQRNKPFSTWIAEVRRDAAISRYDKYPEPLRDIIFLNFSLKLKKALIHEKDIEELSLDQTVARLQNIENKQRSLADSMAKLNPRRPFLPNSPLVNHPNINLTLTQGGDAMDLSATRFQPRGPVAPQERERCRRLGLCYYYGKGRHKAAEYRVRSCDSPEAVSWGLT
ncbi:hypothetical protein K3495_g13441 [Podosphaera aphanis]|nr:hypothetical protein K3495_g13441 [Podosphaera aphanis]